MCLAEEQGKLMAVSAQNTPRTIFRGNKVDHSYINAVDLYEVTKHRVC